MYLIFVSSINENMRLAEMLKKQLDEMGVENKIINLVKLDLPMYTSKEEERGIPLIVKELVKSMKESKGYIFVAPEYNYNLPPVLVNAICWISRNSDDFREAFDSKPIQLATHSGGEAAELLKIMRMQFSKLGAKMMETEIITTYEKALDLKSTKHILENFIQK